MPRTRTTTFKVVGNYGFPFDMLRYDQAWPTHDGVLPLSLITRGENRDDCEQCAGSGLVGTMPSPEDCTSCGGTGFGKRKALAVELSTHLEHAPTVDRWASFGWYVKDIERRAY